MLSQVDQTRLPSFRIGMEQGLQQGFQQGFVLGFLLGFQQGQLQLLKRQIQRRFGPITTVQQARLEQLDRDHLVRLGEDMLDFTRIEDLDDWFGRH